MLGAWGLSVKKVFGFYSLDRGASEGDGLGVGVGINDFTSLTDL